MQPVHKTFRTKNDLLRVAPTRETSEKEGLGSTEAFKANVTYWKV